ncbi:MAG: DegT/DnrJ/EryC1/StrS family aminotransferase [Candidatus Thioglobus sp.]|jgi:perosamine synthetase
MSCFEEVKSNVNGKHIGNELEYVCNVLNSEDRDGRKIPYVGRLEEEFSNVLGSKYAIAHNSGTATLHTCLAAAGVGPGDEVISPAHTVIMCTFAILHQNAIPVYADVELDTLNIDPDDIERKITDKTKAIIAVHMHGLPCDMNKIMKIAKEHNIVVIEDSAQCVLGSIDGKLVGTIGDMASFSFETKKHLSAGEGGIVTTNNKNFATIIRKTGGLGYKTLSADQALRVMLPEEFQDPFYKRHDTVGWNYRMNELTAAVALAQVERVDELVERRQRVAEFFMESIRDCDWIVPQKIPDNFVHTYWTFTVLYYGDNAVSVSWQDFWRKYKEIGGDGFYGGLSVAYQEPVISEGVYKEKIQCGNDVNFNYNGSCPVAEMIQPRMMQFKTNYRNLEIAKQQAQILKDTINFFY